MTAITIPTVGHNLFRDGAQGANSSLITYIALGTGTNTPLAGDTALQAEVFRKAITSYTNGAAIGEILVNIYLAPNDAVGIAINEIGVFGGTSATSFANTGVLIGRGLYSHTKLNTESIQIQFDLTFV